MPDFKVCSKCSKEQPTSNFYNGRVCKDCKKANRKSRAGCSKVAEYNKEYSKTRVYIYSDKRKAQAKLRYEGNKEFLRTQQKEYVRANPDKNRAKEARRRASKLNATPSWLTGEQKAHINRTYKLAQMMQDITGDKYHVDHIVPLQGKNVCGLHVPQNLQVLRADLNLSKSNSH